MSTRCQIIVKDNEEAKIYKHCDGYPEGVMPVLTELLEQFIKERGDDFEYCTAQIIRAFARDDEKHRIEILKKSKKESFDWMIDYYNKPSMLSWGVSNLWHADIEYLYLIDLKNKEVIIYTPTREFLDNPGFDKLKLYETVKINLQQD